MAGKARRAPSDTVMGAGEGLAGGAGALGDFTITWPALRVLPLALVAGGAAAGLALGLLDLIGLITHLAYDGDVGVSLVPPTLHHLGWVTVFIPVVGGLAVGLMARFGSEQIRGHGIPEAMQVIIAGGSRMQPRLALLKPISSAVSIGSGGPFGAEGPIIVTGGAVGSITAQLFRLSAVERRTLLVAGACAGMAAVFGTPVAAVLFGVELLVFEWRPRSFVPIAVAVAAADVIRNMFADGGLLAPAPLFPVPPHGAFGAGGVGGAALIGLAAGVGAVGLTALCYGFEDLFKKLPIHWMWWPAIGGAVVGLGGLIDPRALGVGYGVISAELAGRLAVGALLLLLVVKLVIWSVALGSGTSGGILAPLLMVGAALGGIIGHLFGGPVSTWSLLGMAAVLAGVTRSPLTATVFAFELTHDTGSLLPLLTACAIAHLVSSLVLKRSILTEKVARKGYHVMREYAVDHLEGAFVADAMRAAPVTTSGTTPSREVLAWFDRDPRLAAQRIIPVVDGDDRLEGVVDRYGLLGAAGDVGEHRRPAPVIAGPGETLRAVADRMADADVDAVPVVDSADRRVVGVLTLRELLASRHRSRIDETQRTRGLGPRSSASPSEVGPAPPLGDGPDGARSQELGAGAEPSSEPDGPDDERHRRSPVP